MLIIILLSNSNFVISSKIINNNKTEPNIINNFKIPTWSRIYGGKHTDQLFSVIQNNNNEFIFVGWTSSYGSGNQDVWLIKTDYEGNMIWNKTYGGKKREMGFSVIQTCDDGYAIIGYTESFGNGLWDMWLIKIDSNGTEKWNVTIGGYDYDWGASIQELDDRSFIITGYTSTYGEANCNVWLVKTNPHGEKIWDKTYGGNLCESGFSLIIIKDGFIMAGYTESFGSGRYDGWIIKTDFEGNQIWNKTIGGKYDDIIRSIEQIDKNGFILAGWTNSYNLENQDILITKIDNSGNVLWNKTFGYNYDDGAYSLCKTKDNGIVIVGYSGVSNINQDIIMIKMDTNGTKLWERTFGGRLIDGGFSVISVNDGGFLIAGYTKSYSFGKEDAWIIKTDANGKNIKNNLNYFTNLFDIFMEFLNVFQNYPSSLKLSFSHFIR
jgi:hypothetical protein